MDEEKKLQKRDILGGKLYSIKNAIANKKWLGEKQMGSLVCHLVLKEI